MGHLSIHLKSPLRAKIRSFPELLVLTTTSRIWSLDVTKLHLVATSDIQNQRLGFKSQSYTFMHCTSLYSISFLLTNTHHARRHQFYIWNQESEVQLTWCTRQPDSTRRFLKMQLVESGRGLVHASCMAAQRCHKLMSHLNICDMFVPQSLCFSRPIANDCPFTFMNGPGNHPPSLATYWALKSQLGDRSCDCLIFDVSARK